jgi:hypothetical protein
MQDKQTWMDEVREIFREAEADLDVPTGDWDT